MAASDYYTMIRREPTIVGYWRQNDIAGTIQAADWAARYGLLGVYNAIPATSVLLDGASGYVSVPYNSALMFPPAGGWSISGWWKPPSSMANGTYIVGRGGAGVVEISVSGGNAKLQWSAADNTQSSGMFTMGAWHYWAITFDGTTMCFYIDGSPSGTSTPAAWSVGSTAFTIAANTGGGSNLPGNLEYISKFSSVLSAGQVAAHYNATNYRQTVLAESSLVSLWPLGESSGTVAADVKGTNNGTYTNGVGPVAAAATAGAESTSGTLTINKPAGTVQGDLLIAAFAVGNTVATLAGWTPLRADANGSIDNSQLFYKVAGATEPASYAWGFSSALASGVIARWTGASQTAPINASASAHQVASGGSSPTVTTTVGGCALLTIAIADTNSAAADSFTFAAACTSQGQQTAAGPAVGIAYDTANQVGAGVSTARAVTDANGHQMYLYTVAIQPACLLGQPGAPIGVPNRLLGPALIQGDPAAASSVLSGANMAISDTAPLRIVGDISIEAWLMPYSASETAGILGKRNPANTFAAPYAFTLRNGQLSFELGNGSSSVILTGGTVPLVPLHAVATCFRGTMRLYLNGVQIAQGALGAQAVADAGQSLYAGAFGSVSGVDLLSEVVLYNGALSARRVARHFAVGQRVISDPAHYLTIDPPVLA
jgi:hypothetical protein